MLPAGPAAFDAATLALALVFKPNVPLLITYNTPLIYHIGLLVPQNKTTQPLKHKAPTAKR